MSGLTLPQRLTPRMLAAASLVLLVTGTALADRVTSLKLAGDGKTIVVGNADKTVRVVNVADGKELRRITFTEVPMAVAVSPNGKTVAVGGFGILGLYEHATGKVIATAPDPLGHLSVNSMAFLPDGKTVVAGGDAGRIRMFDAVTGKQVKDLTGFKGTVNAVVVSPDGKTIGAAGLENNVGLWDAGTGAAGLVMKGHKTWLTGLTFTSDGKQIVSLDQNAHIFMWEVASGKQVGNVDGDNGWSYAIAASPDGKLLAWGVEGGVRLWDTATKKAGDKLLCTSAVVTSVAFSADCKTIFVGDYKGAVTAIDIASKAKRVLGS